MTPRTGAEQRTFSQLSSLDHFFDSCRAPAMGAYAMSCGPTTSLDIFSDRLDNQFDVDWPVFCALLPQLASADPQGTAQLLYEMAEGQIPKDVAKADMAIDRLWKEAKDAAFGWGNLPGNVVTSAEIGLRAAWKAQVRLALSGLASGRKLGSVKLSPHITLESFKIGKGGDLRKGAAIKVRIKGLPMTVMHALPAPVVMKAGGAFGSMRVSPANTRAMVSAGDAITNARSKSSTFLRIAGAKGVPGLLAFGPSAVIDLANSIEKSGDSSSVNWRGFAVRSASSQSGNAAGFAAGAIVTGVTGFFAGAVVAGSLPVLVIAFGFGLVVQAAWNYSGTQDKSAKWVEDRLK